MALEKTNYAPETDDANEIIYRKLREHFDGKIVRKDLTKAIKEGANVPVYVLEFLLGQYCSSDDPKIIEEGVRNVKRILAENFVRPDEAQKVLSGLRERGSYTVIDRITVGLNIKFDRYEADFSKHAPLEVVPRIRMVWQSIPSQLSKENKKFIYGVLREGSRAKDFELAIQWLLDCGLLLKSHRISKPGFPVSEYFDLSTFKLYLHDVGLLGALSGIDVTTLIRSNDLFTEFKGALTEQYTMQQLRLDSNRPIANRTNERSTSEVDFIVQHQGEVIPIEVKAGENTRSKSFRLFCDKFQPKQAYRFSLLDFKTESWMENIPLYAIESLFK